MLAGVRDVPLPKIDLIKRGIFTLGKSLFCITKHHSIVQLQINILLNFFHARS